MHPQYDDLDELTGVPRRRGAHRPRPNPLAAAVPAILVVLAVGAVAIGVWTLLGTSPTSSSGQTSSPPPAASSTPAPSATSSTHESSHSPSSTSASVAADRNQPLVVLNSTSKSGLAAKAAASLKKLGWTVTRTGNAKGNGQTTVYYATPEQKPSAELVVKDLGTGTVKQSGSYGLEVTVILGGDYTP